MNRLKKHIIAIVLATIIMTGCQVTAIQPAISSVISPQNAGQLQIARQAQVGAYYDLVWSLDNTHILLLQGSEAARVKTDALTVSDRFSFETSVMMLSAAPDGRTVVFSTDGMNLQIKDISSTQAAEVINSGVMINNIDFSPDGRWLLVTSMDAIEARLWDTASRKEVKTLSGFETAAPVYNTWFGSDSAHILWVSRGTVQPMAIDSGQFGPQLSHEDFVNDAELSPDGKLIATAAYGTVRDDYLPLMTIWDAVSGEPLGLLPDDKDSFTALAFSPDSRLIAAANGARITVWDAENPQLLADLDSGTDFIAALAFSADGSMLASISSDGTLAIWQVK